ncbi:MAG TPA: hypothetical protein VFB58_11600 [Chloroflexota bacterium]|nr:hypothetical protein [Chloroflexota bacterium]
MPINVSNLHVGADVYARGGSRLGTVKRIWWPDGRVVPPEAGPQGLLDIEGSGRRLEPGEGYFHLDRPLANDWFVPFSAIQDVAGNRVQLDLTELEAEKRGWQERPTTTL